MEVTLSPLWLQRIPFNISLMEILINSIQLLSQQK